MDFTVNPSWVLSGGPLHLTDRDTCCLSSTVFHYPDVVVLISMCRFFSSSTSAASRITKEDLPQPEEPTAGSPTTLIENDVPDIPSVDTPSPPASPSTTSPSTASQGPRLFLWSGSSSTTDQSIMPKSSSGLAALQQFQYKKESVSFSTKTVSPSRPTADGTSVQRDLQDSPPSQDSAYFSQPHLTSCRKEEMLVDRFPSSSQEDAKTVRSNTSTLPFKSICRPLMVESHSHTHQSFMVWEFVCRMIF